MILWLAGGTSCRQDPGSWGTHGDESDPALARHEPDGVISPLRETTSACKDPVAGTLALNRSQAFPRRQAVTGRSAIRKPPAGCSAMD